MVNDKILEWFENGRGNRKDVSPNAPARFMFYADKQWHTPDPSICHGLLFKGGYKKIGTIASRFQSRTDDPHVDNWYYEWLAKKFPEFVNREGIDFHKKYGFIIEDASSFPHGELIINFLSSSRRLMEHPEQLELAYRLVTDGINEDVALAIVNSIKENPDGSFVNKLPSGHWTIPSYGTARLIDGIKNLRKLKRKVSGIPIHKIFSAGVAIDGIWTKLLNDNTDVYRWSIFEASGIKGEVSTTRNDWGELTKTYKYTYNNVLELTRTIEEKVKGLK